MPQRGTITTTHPRSRSIRQAMPRLNRILLGALTLASLGLVGTVWHQQVELRRLQALLERASSPATRTLAGGDSGRPAGSTLTHAAARPLTRPSPAVRAPERDDEFSST